MFPTTPDQLRSTLNQHMRLLEQRLSINGDDSELYRLLRTLEYFDEQFLTDAIENIEHATKMRLKLTVLERQNERCWQYVTLVQEQGQVLPRELRRRLSAMKQRLAEVSCTRDEIWRMLTALEHIVNLNDHTDVSCADECREPPINSNGHHPAQLSLPWGR